MFLELVRGPLVLRMISTLESDKLNSDVIVVVAQCQDSKKTSGGVSSTNTFRIPGENARMCFTVPRHEIRLG